MTEIATDGEVRLALEELAAATDRAEVKQRPGPGGKVIDYIDARYVFDRLDAAVGPTNWQTQLFAVNGGMLAGIGIKLGGEWIWKWDGGDPSDIEGFKGQISDSIKRAAVQWGIARDLYGSASVAPTPPRVPCTSGCRADAGRPDVPASAAPTAEWAEGDFEETPQCPVHHKPMRHNAKGWYCPTKIGQGPKDWCQETAA